MAMLDDVRAERMRKLELLQKSGMDPYPIDARRTHANKEFLDSFSDLESEGSDVTLDGRIMSLRDQGGIIFADIFDGSARVQTLVKKDDLPEEQFSLFVDAVDASDFIEVTGKAFTTKRGVSSLSVTSWRMLAKSMRPIPDEWFGLKDEDERYRKRYIDILLNQNVAELVKKRSVFWNTIRQFMLQRDFVEVETPTLENTTGGADARPFVTHHNALDMDVYLRISAGELWQKKLLVAGLPKVFEIGRIFRNEGMSREHLQDYTQFEYYEAFSDYTKGMQAIQDLYRTIAKETFGTTSFTIGEHTVDLMNDWKTYDFCDVLKEQFGIDPLQTTEKEVVDALKKADIEYDTKTINLERGVDLLWKKVRKTISGPAFLVGVPVYLEPLAKRSPQNSKKVERFQVLLAGSEMGKGFSELNDPVDQRQRFEYQQALRDAGDEEAQMADFEYVEALEYGMPPAFGFGLSERLFSFLAGVDVREGQIFPLMRPK